MSLPISSRKLEDRELSIAYAEYYIVVSEEVQPRQTDNQGRVVALDPGVRAFMTFFSESFYGWIGNDSNLLIQIHGLEKSKRLVVVERLKILMEIR